MSHHFGVSRRQLLQNRQQRRFRQLAAGQHAKEVIGNTDSRRRSLLAEKIGQHCQSAAADQTSHCSRRCPDKTNRFGRNPDRPDRKTSGQIQHNAADSRQHMQMLMAVKV